MKKIINKFFNKIGIKVTNLKTFIEKTEFYEKKFFLESLSNSDLHPRVLKYFIDNYPQSKSQLCQDLFVNYLMENLNVKFPYTFAEFGATDGLYLSNTKLLEEKGWVGLLAEPARHFHNDLRKNRNSLISLNAIGAVDKQNVTFYETENKSLSTLKQFVGRDFHSDRRVSGKINAYEVKQISINSFLKNLNAEITYLSIDTEGGEYEIILALDLKKFRPKFISIEHNFTEDELRIDEYLENRHYQRVYRNFFSFDSFFIDKSAYFELKQKDLI